VATPTERLSPRLVAREALAALRAHWAALMVTAVVVFVPVGLAEAVTHSVEDLDTGESGVGAVLAVLGAAFVLTATSTFGDVFYAGVVTSAVRERRTGVGHQLADIARHLPYLRLIAVDLVFALVVAAGMLALIVPGIVAFTWYSLSAPVVEIEGLGVRAAFRRSHELVRGDFWRVLALLAPLVIVGDALATLFLDSGPWILGDGFLGDWLGATLAEGVTALVFALAAAVTALHLMAAKPAPAAGPASPRTPPR
jgi:hypothetical protein